MGIRIYVHSSHGVIQTSLSMLVSSFGYTPISELDAEIAVRELCCYANYPPPFTIPTLALIADGEANAEKVLLLGYRGYIRSSQEASQLKLALQAVRNGENWAERKVVARILGNRTDSTLSSFEKEMGALTRREREVFDLLVLGLSNRVIAKRLNITEKTVKGYASSLYSKLGVEGRTSIILHFQQKA